MVNILVIENDDFTAAELSSWLKKQGYGVDRVRSGNDGLRQLQNLSYDLAIVGELPDMPSLEICRRVTNSNLFLPVMVLSSSNDVEDKIRVLDSGAQDCMDKPCQLTELSARLRSLLRRYARKGAVPAFTPPVLVPPPVGVPLVP